ncbi:hypothetical protein F5Y10DRAFT_293629 [Nemania abortiva]|nr:hypothetical protein F5Y10DRAFT_293629 [Nemania abortiva]
MSHTILTSHIRSPPGDLRPAPLRIPRRKTAACPTANGSRILVAENKGRARDTSATTPSRKDPVQNFQLDIPCSLPQRRNPGSKFESLVSRFETRDAVNSDDTRVPQHLYSSHEATSKKNLLHSPMSYSPTEPKSRAPSESSPRQIQISATSIHSHCTTSAIPPASRRLPKSKSFRRTSLSLPRPPSVSAISPHQVRKFPRIKDVSERQGGPQKLNNDLKPIEGPNIIPPKQRLSISQIAEPSGESIRLGFRPKPSLHSEGRTQDMAPPASSKRPPEPKAVDRPPALPVRTSSSHPPLFGRGQIVYVRPKARVAEEPSFPRPAGDSLRDDSQEALLEESRSSNEQTKPESNMSLEISMDGLATKSPDLQRELSIGGYSASRDRFRSQKILSPSSRPAHGGGKVSQLRKLFERPSGRFSSPLSLVNFSSRLDLREPTGELAEDCLSSSWNESASPSSTRTIARRRSMVPSLTTEISVNDFFCDFVSGADHEENPITASPSQTAAEVGSRMKHESPVKRRIQQFEHLSRDSLKARTAADYHGKADDSEPPSTNDENKKGGKRRNIGGWRPIHQTGVAIWRKISSSFSRSVDSWKDCNSEHEHTKLTAATGSSASLDRLSPLENGSRHHPRRSSSFGYSMHRVSHTSRRLMSTSQTMPSIQPGMSDSSNRYSKTGLNVSSGPSCPSTPPVFRKSLPTIAHVSGGLGQYHWFGLDGHFISKPVLDEDFRSSEATASRLSTPQGDPNALHKVMLKQSAAERSRRRQGDKHLHRDKKARALAKWKGKCKANVTPELASGAIPREESDNKHGRGKGKGKGKEKEKEMMSSGRGSNEGQASMGKESETNKKTESGFVVFESKDVKLRHPRPRRPGPVRKMANMYRDKGSSGMSVNTKASSGATLKEGRQSFRQKASSALGLRRRKGSGAAG